MSNQQLDAVVVLPKKRALAFAISGVIASGAGSVSAQTGQIESIEEVVVTARKRTENLQDIPQSVQAFSTADIERYGFQGVSDFARFIPSLSFIESSPGQTKIVFRGVADSDVAFLAAPTSAVYLDEQTLTMGSQAVAVRPVDIERIEALSGPQGSLYGASSQAGTLKYVTNKPSTEKFESNIGVGVSTIEDGEESYDVDAMVNFPVSDNFAIRLVGFHARDGGFIDNVLGTTPETGLRSNASVVGKDINEVEFTGGRASARWYINDKWTNTISFNYQKINAKGFNDYDPTVGDLDTIKFFREGRDDEYYTISNVIEGDLGYVNVMLATSYFDREIAYVQDTTTYSSYFDLQFGAYYATYDFGQDPVGFRRYDQNDDRVTIEARVSHEDSRWKWVVGFFYEDRHEDWDFKTFTHDYRNSPSFAAWSGYYPSQVGNFGDAWWNSFENIDAEDISIFGETTFSLTENFDVIFGGRWFDTKTKREYAVEKPDNRQDRATVTPSGSDNGFLPKFGVNYRFSDDKMVYALASQGFRPGGVNRGRTRPINDPALAAAIGQTESSPTFPVAYEGDTLKNYEIGAKTQWMDGRLQVNLTGYHMKWENYLLEVIDPSFGSPLFFPFQIVVANVGDAVINGIDFDITAIPTPGLRLTFNGTYLMDHELDEDVRTVDQRIVALTGDTTPALDLPEGTELPLSPDFNMSATAEYTWPVNFMNGADMYVRFQYSYTGESTNTVEFQRGIPSPFKIQDEYHIGDIKIGMVTEKWEGEFFVKNLWDERPEIWRQVDEFETFFGRDRIQTSRPRSIGARFRYRW